MIDLVLPTTRKRLTQDNYALYEIGPVLFPVSRSLANALRRVLLSSLPGAAITSVQIDGVFHEFQDIRHVKEDVPDIVQNLKKVRLRSFSERPITVYLDVQGERIVRAGDIKTPGTIEIVNPDAHIATLDNENAHLSMEMTVGVGRGFVSAETLAQEGTQQPRGVILVDAIYSPLLHVNFKIEQTQEVRSPGRDVFAVITLEITTDGSISPDEALRQSADILYQQFAVFANGRYERDTEEPTPHLSDVPIPKDIYEMSLGDLGLSVRASGILNRNGYRTVGRLLEMDGRDILAMHNMGKKTLQEICDCLKNRGLLPEGSGKSQT